MGSDSGVAVGVGVYVGKGVTVRVGVLVYVELLCAVAVRVGEGLIGAIKACDGVGTEVSVVETGVMGPGWSGVGFGGARLTSVLAVLHADSDKIARVKQIHSGYQRRVG